MTNNFVNAAVSTAKTSSTTSSTNSSTSSSQKIEPKLLTVCYVIDGEKVLLGMKKRGFGAGRWNGFGGKLKDNETLFDAARRELKEEASITVNSFDERGYLIFKTADRPQDLKVHVFVANRYVGTPQESEEMRPEWFNLNDLPWDLFWSSDAYWLKEVLIEGKHVVGEFTFDKEDKVIAHKVKFFEE